MLRVFIRLMKDVKAIDPKKYVAREGVVDEIGRLLGGWIKSTKGGNPEHIAGNLFIDMFKIFFDK